MRLLVVDGEQLLFRYFSTMSGELEIDGHQMGAVSGCLYGLQKSMRLHRATHLTVAFDQGKNTFRHQKYPDYKAGRTPRPPEMVLQKEWLIRLLQSANVHTWEHPDFEADDFIASVSIAARRQGIPVVVDARDKDLYELAADPDIMLWDAVLKSRIDLERIQAKTNGCPIARIVDWLALVGDDADNIPGVEGIGTKTAGVLLARKGSLDNLLADLSDVPAKAKDRLHQGRQRIVWFRDLMTLRTNLPVPEMDAMVFPSFSVQNLLSTIKIHQESSSGTAKQETLEDEIAF